MSRHMIIQIKSHLQTVHFDAARLSEILWCFASNGVHHTSRARIGGNNVGIKFTRHCWQLAAHHTTSTVLLWLLKTQVVE